MPKDDFFDAFGDDELEIDWSKVSMERIEKIFSKLSKQDSERIYNELKTVIDTNNKTKAVIGVAFQVLQVAVKLGLKVI